MTHEESSIAPIDVAESPQLAQPAYPTQPMEAEERLTLAEKAADWVLAIEPVWVTIAVAVVYAMVQTGGRYPWIPLVFAAMPFPLRWWRRGHISKRTSFDIPIAIFLAGAVVGTIVSDDLTLSLGAFQSCLAAALLYYSLVNYPQPKRLLVGVLGTVCVATVGICLWGFSEGFTPVSGTSSLSSWASDFFGSGPARPAGIIDADPFNPMVHGLALVFTIAFCVFLGIVVFAKKRLLRLAVAIPCLLLILFGLLSSGEALSGLWEGTTIDGRMTLWRETIPIMNAHPWTGIGLGNFPLVTPVSLVAHPHNSYLELYMNYGILGIAAAALVAVIIVKLGWDILRSSRKHPWFGFGCGVLLAIVATALVGLIESAPMGMPATGTNAFHYVVSPVPWILGAILIVGHRILTKDDESQEMAENRFLAADDINRVLS